ncbi:MAG: hypothetical protein C4297_08700 [Gemmataceae bacterium]
MVSFFASDCKVLDNKRSRTGIQNTVGDQKGPITELASRADARKKTMRRALLMGSEPPACLGVGGP